MIGTCLLTVQVVSWHIIAGEKSLYAMLCGKSFEGKVNAEFQLPVKYSQQHYYVIIFTFTPLVIKASTHPLRQPLHLPRSLCHDTSY